MPDDPQAARNDERSGAPLRLPPLNSKPGSKPDSKRASARGKAAKQRDDANEELLGAFETISRRINDLARELKCLGYFDDDDNRPRAA